MYYSEVGKVFVKVGVLQNGCSEEWKSDTQLPIMPMRKQMGRH